MRLLFFIYGYVIFIYLINYLYMRLLFFIYGYEIILVWKGYSLAAAEYVRIFS